MAVDFNAIKAPPMDEASGCNNQEDIDTQKITHEHAKNESEREKRALEEQIRDSQLNREQRKEFATKTYHLTVYWLITIVVILLFQGWSIYEPCPQCLRFNLSDNVLIALITGASINIIGLLAIVIRHLFPSNGKNIKHKW